ncbi:hypothetical protein [Paraburkholderia caledonica]|uniref:hypothetical protein n=1 Tax=Paraburkholderia caledonica TaxID=134536 RepID=UPI0038BB9EBD
MKMEFDYASILASKGEQGLKELIIEAERDNALARDVIARNDRVKAMCQHRLIGLQVQQSECE